MPMSKFQVDRFRVIWLTLVTCLVSGIMLFLNPSHEAAILFDFTRNMAEASSLLEYPATAANLNLLRANHIADCLFVFAYGALLCATIQSRFRLRYSVEDAARKRIERIADNAIGMTGALVLFNLLEDVFSLLLLAEMPAANTPLQSIPWWVPLLFAGMRWAARLKFLAAAGSLASLSVLWLPVMQNRKRRRRSQSVALLFATASASSGFVLLLSFSPAVAYTGGFALLTIFAASTGILLQLCLWGDMALCAKIAYLCRVPLVVLTLLAALGPLALGPGASMLQAILIFDPLQTIRFGKVTGPGQLALVFAIALIIAFACTVQLSLILQYGWERVSDVSLKRLFGDQTRRVVRWTAIAAALLLGLSANIASFAPSLFTRPAHALFSLLGSLLVGGIIAIGSLYCSELMQAWLTPPELPLPQLIVSASFCQSWGWGARIMRWHQDQSPLAMAVRHSIQRVVGAVFRHQGRGYCDANVFLYTGHTYALCLSSVSAGIYLILLIFNSPFWGDPKALIPALASVLLIVLAASWFFSGMAFLLDRYRVPLVSAFALLWILLGLLPVTDFVFDIGDESGATYAVRTPAEVLNARGAEHPILVAAAGGGIQAAVWTTRVLASLDADTHGEFRRHLALVSSVSGGSVGALYAGSYFDERDGWNTAYQQSQLSSLDEVGWAMVGPDLFHPIFSLAGAQKLDRGNTLEHTLEQRMSRPASIREWASRPLGHFPAFLFNATVAETGEPVAFATTQMPSRAFEQKSTSTISGAPVVKSAAVKFQLRSASGNTVRGSGLSVATAARLSAAFPYVSPASRPSWNVDRTHPGFHIVDGGYYDNYGLVALSQWLDDALESGTVNTKRVSVVIIRGPRDEESEGTEPWPGTRQLSAPMSAFLGVRNVAQWSGGSATLNLLIQKWASRIDIRSYVFEYPDLRLIEPKCAAPPLSWKMTSAQIACVDDAWKFEVYHRPHYQRLLSTLR